MTKETSEDLVRELTAMDPIDTIDIDYDAAGAQTIRGCVFCKEEKDTLLVEEVVVKHLPSCLWRRACELVKIGMYLMLI